MTTLSHPACRETTSGARTDLERWMSARFVKRYTFGGSPSSTSGVDRFDVDDASCRDGTGTHSLMVVMDGTTLQTADWVKLDVSDVGAVALETSAETLYRRASEWKYQ